MCSMRVYPVSCQLSCSAVKRGWGIQIYLEMKLMNYYFNYSIAIILIIWYVLSQLLPLYKYCLIVIFSNTIYIYYCF